MATAPRSSDSRGIFVNIRVSGSNESYLGYLHIYNASFVMPPVIQPRFNSKSSNQDHPNDPKGAGYYVVVIVLIYGMSIIALIASHIKRKHSKLVEDRQIHKYLKVSTVPTKRITAVPWYGPTTALHQPYFSNATQLCCHI
jgi:hypothetical protein